MRNRQRMGRWSRTIGGLWIVLILLSSCITTRDRQPALDAARTLAFDELPIGLGRGYLVAGLDETESNQGTLQPGELAPNFHLLDTEGRHLSLQDLQGRPVLLNFWATWCGPCRLEMPELVAAAQNNEDLVVLAINVQEELEQIQAFAEDFQMNMPIVRDTNGDLKQLYGVTGMPTSVFIDREGKIANVWPGILNKKRLHQYLTTIQ
jgi:cytochrome c biogenesis protein CcmG, thiol:disulfide interchange protein DsbE